jgi:hypothetical protein
MLHCGANEVERKALTGIVLPPATDTYMPIGHDTVVDLAEDRLAQAGFRFGAQAHALTHDGARYFGLVELMNGCDNEEYAMIAAFRNSIDKSFPAAMGFGSHVFVCDNLAFTAEIKFSRKHTVHIMRDLPNLIGGAVNQTQLFKVNQEARFECYQEFRIRSTIRADHIILDMLRRGAINTSRVQKVMDEWDNPSYDHGPKTAWRMFNAATQALKPANKGVPLHDLPPRTIALQELLDEVVGFVPEAPAITADDWEG